jgi:hypothetical protein
LKQKTVAEDCSERSSMKHTVAPRCVSGPNGAPSEGGCKCVLIMEEPRVGTGMRRSEGLREGELAAFLGRSKVFSKTSQRFLK